MHDNDLAITVTKKNEEIKSLQEEYAEAFSTNPVSYTHLPLPTKA